MINIFIMYLCYCSTFFENLNLKPSSTRVKNFNYNGTQRKKEQTSEFE